MKDMDARNLSNTYWASHRLQIDLRGALCTHSITTLFELIN